MDGTRTCWRPPGRLFSSPKLGPDWPPNPSSAVLRPCLLARRRSQLSSTRQPRRVVGSNDHNSAEISDETQHFSHTGAKILPIKKTPRSLGEDTVFFSPSSPSPPRLLLFLLKSHLGVGSGQESWAHQVQWERYKNPFCGGICGGLSTLRSLCVRRQKGTAQHLGSPFSCSALNTRRETRGRGGPGEGGGGWGRKKRRGETCLSRLVLLLLSSSLVLLCRVGHRAAGVFGW